MKKLIATLALLAALALPGSGLAASWHDGATWGGGNSPNTIFCCDVW